MLASASATPATAPAVLPLLRFVLRADRILATSRVVALPARTLPRTGITLTDRPTLHRVGRSPEARRIMRAREALTARTPAPDPVADCTAELEDERRGAAWGGLASLALLVVLVALCVACAAH